MFSASARKTAEMLSKRIVLIDGSQLARSMVSTRVVISWSSGSDEPPSGERS
ncbi:hypothetical protein MKK63_12765 [Methylobacterium sp. J-088]|uniref:hypothetical protein n=1 Tax=Methylobacterium sp. J-088 TaxID=2836664 RepID=UPI001FB9B848|nr:hypothetical protein [Methylobacterium sp. J-088]MCJ2063578.1 hypothetical protein [Methylobacterium sp. J-088]